MKKVVLYDSFQFGKGKMLKLHMEKIQDIKEEIESDGNEIIGEFYDKCNEFLRPEKRPRNCSKNTSIRLYYIKKESPEFIWKLMTICDVYLFWNFSSGSSRSI